MADSETPQVKLEVNSETKNRLMSDDEPPLRSSTPDHMIPKVSSATASPQNPSNDSSGASGLDVTLSPPKLPVVSAGAAASASAAAGPRGPTRPYKRDYDDEDNDDGGDDDEEFRVRRPSVNREDLLTNIMLDYVCNLTTIIEKSNKHGNQCLAIQDTVTLMQPLIDELQLQWKNLSRRRRRHLDIYLSCLLQWLDYIEYLLMKCCDDIPKYQLFHHLFKAVKGVSLRRKIIDTNLKIRSAVQHLLTAMITCNVQISSQCRNQIFDDIRKVLETEGPITKKQLNSTAQELYEKQLEMEKKILEKLRKKEKKHRATMSGGGEGTDISEKPPERVGDLTVETAPKKELAAISEEAEEAEGKIMVLPEVHPVPKVATKVEAN